MSYALTMSPRLAVTPATLAHRVDRSVLKDRYDGSAGLTLRRPVEDVGDVQPAGVVLPHPMLTVVARGEVHRRAVCEGHGERRQTLAAAAGALGAASSAATRERRRLGGAGLGDRRTGGLHVMGAPVVGNWVSTFPSARP